MKLISLILFMTNQLKINIIYKNNSAKYYVVI